MPPPLMTFTPLCFKRRPALWSAGAFSFGILLADPLALDVIAVWLAGVTLFVLGLFLGRSSGSRALALDLSLFSLVFACGALRYESDTALLPASHIGRTDLFGAKAMITGTILEEPQRGSDRTRVLLALEEVENDSARFRVSGRIMVTFSDLEIAADYADRIVVSGRLQKPAPARNPGAFDYRRFLKLRDTWATVSVRKQEQIVRVVGNPGDALYEYLILPIRASVRRSIERNLSGAPSGLLRGMLLGEKHRIPSEVADAFRGTGLAHALVISGLHVGLVAVFFLTAFKLCRMSSRTTTVTTVAVLALYAFVTELQPPVVRAVIMVSVVLLGRALGRVGDIYNSLGLAALIILAVWPTSLFTLSFQLSFGATLSIVALYGPLTCWVPATWKDGLWEKWVVGPACVSLAAQLGTGPLIAYHFQQVAPLSLPANLLVVPILGLAVGLGLLSAITGWIFPLLATAFNGCNYLVLVFLTEVVGTINSLPGSSLTCPKPGMGFLTVCVACVVLLAHCDSRRCARHALVYTVLLYANLSLWSSQLREGRLQITSLDVGQGDGAFVEFPNGRTMIVDAGIRSAHFDYGKRVLVPFLRHRGVRHIDMVVASHPHSDHIGGLVYLLEHVRVDHFIDSGQAYDSWTSRRLHELIRANKIQYHRVAAGDSLVGLGGVGAIVLHPTSAFVTAVGESPHDLNNGSVVLRLEAGSNSVLFTGDIEVESDPAMLGWGERLQSTILKVAHHGSKTSSRPAFVDAVNPRIAIISVGSFNKFGHPSQQILARLNARCRVYRTDRDGAVTIRVDESISLESMIGDQLQRPRNDYVAKALGIM